MTPVAKGLDMVKNAISSTFDVFPFRGVYNLKFLLQEGQESHQMFSQKMIAPCKSRVQLFSRSYVVLQNEWLLSTIMTRLHFLPTWILRLVLKIFIDNYQSYTVSVEI